MSVDVVEKNLIDLQPQGNPTGPRSLSHYQRSDRKCVTVQILPYTRPYVLPFSKVLTADDFINVISTLPEASATDAAEVKTNLQNGKWRIIDEAGLVVRIQDWEDLAGEGAQVIVDTNGGVKRESERVDAPPPPPTTATTTSTSTTVVSADAGEPEVVSTNGEQEKTKPAKHAVDQLASLVTRAAKDEPEEAREEKEEEERETTEPHPQQQKKAIEEPRRQEYRESVSQEQAPAAPAGDPEWASWDATNQKSQVAGSDWDTTGPVAPVDEGWGSGSVSAPRDSDWGSSTPRDSEWGTTSSSAPRDSDWGSNSTFHPREKGSATTRWPRNSVSNSDRSSYIPREPSTSKPYGKTWKVQRSTSPNGFSKGKFPKKVHLTFYAPFKLPRGFPPTPQPLYNRFSIPPETTMSQVALKVLSRHPFSNMPVPNGDFEPENHVFVFLELKEEVVDGKRVLERGRIMKVLGRTSMEEMGLSTEGGMEGFGRYYFIVKDFFARDLDFEGIERN
ncbi:hypothetical protein AOL_s00173g206 [Orbilia oligospora ATCC 24927]|uniref:Uncharacterized protein n=2 Tax=Orbilia oligospora TaxID=2813651 RepID=G1XP38_ARTOA|nr:hypothetical protein AOL_s00173g206 [Orbilia oligospora ATCC 24927]EGX45105.1 hypothetical protein AOL_s00173g206 [Orbilia oligospora ATCC 24927]KAF3286815.1 hypothetical protein TWF970_008654 [Orbilia oligospora]